METKVKEIREYVDLRKSGKLVIATISVIMASLMCLIPVGVKAAPSGGGPSPGSSSGSQQAQVSTSVVDTASLASINSIRSEGARTLNTVELGNNFYSKANTSSLVGGIVAVEYADSVNMGIVKNSNNNGSRSGSNNDRGGGMGSDGNMNSSDVGGATGVSAHDLNFVIREVRGASRDPVFVSGVFDNGLGSDKPEGAKLHSEPIVAYLDVGIEGLMDITY